MAAASASGASFDSFQERRLPLTVFGCALALERHPLAARTIAESGYDVCCHGWAVGVSISTSMKPRSGTYPQSYCLVTNYGRHASLGWYCRYGPSVNTRRLIVEDEGSCTIPMPITTSYRTGSRSVVAHIW